MGRPPPATGEYAIAYWKSEISRLPNTGFQNGHLENKRKNVDVLHNKTRGTFAPTFTCNTQSRPQIALMCNYSVAICSTT